MFKHQSQLLGISRVTILTALISAISPLIFSAHVNAQEQDSTSANRVTAISQIKDVSPSDPYFPALQALVEQYGCIALPADGNFRADEPLTRGEAAILVHSCLSKMAELIEVGAVKPAQ